MGFKHTCLHSHSHLILSLLFLLVSTSTHFRITAQGRPVSKHLDTSSSSSSSSSHIGEEEKVLMRAQIGSRPPRCDRRCSSCGHCVAVQVPIAPQVKTKNKRFSTDYMRGEDNSNYKPMSWKCKCGDMIFNP